MRLIRFSTILGCMLSLFVAGAGLAADVPGTKAGGKSSQEPPPPKQPGNPFPPNPDKPLKNPLRDESKNLNPQNDPYVQDGIRKNYKQHQEKKK